MASKNLGMGLSWGNGRHKRQGWQAQEGRQGEGKQTSGRRKFQSWWAET